MSSSATGTVVAHSVAPVYEDSLTLREARRRYFDAYGFGDGGYEASWVALKPVLGIPIGFPNSDARRRAVKLHDLHHVLTGYTADWTGEAEIAAWELGTGCGSHVAAWVIDTATLQYGIFLAPRAVLAALARGRRSKSLYSAHELDEAMLDATVGETKARLRIPDEVRPGLADVVVLAGWVLAGLAMWTLPIAGAVALVRALL